MTNKPPSTNDSAVIADGPKPVTTTGRASHNISQHSKIVILIIVFVLGAGVAAYFYNKSHQEVKPYSQVYSATASKKLLGGADGHGISFKKMSQLSDWGNEPDDQYSAKFVQLTQSTDGKTIIAINRLSVEVKDFGSNAPSDAQIQKYNKVATGNTQNQNFKIATAPIVKFVQAAFPEKGMLVTIDNVQTFTNPNIKVNAWQFSLTITDTTGVTPTHKAKVLDIIGKNSYYLFLTTAIESNWESNSGAFQDVLNSVKIDQ